MSKNHEKTERFGGGTKVNYNVLMSIPVNGRN